MLPTLAHLSSLGRWPEARFMFVSPDCAEVWYIAGRSQSSNLLWGAYMSPKTFRTGTVSVDVLAGWKFAEIGRILISQLAVTWLARRWVLVPC
jgi:hypothetical protein